MTITTTWHIANLDRATADGKVTTIHYTVDSTDGTHTAGAYGSIGIDGDIRTPYDKLTEAVCLEWLKGSLGDDKVQEVEAALAANLAEQAAPSRATGVPW